MLIRNLLAAGLALLAVGGNDASAAYIKCNSCTPSAYQSLAQQRGNGSHVVFDLVNRRVVGFDVHWDAETHVWEVESTSVAPEIVAVGMKLADLHRETGGSMRGVAEVGVSQLGLTGLGGASAYDVLNDRNLELRVGDYLAQFGLPVGTWTSTFENLFAAVNALGFGITGITDAVELNVKVVFVDGTSLVYRLVPGRPSAKLLAGSGRYSNGEGLLEANTATYAASYHFASSGSLPQFLQRAAQLGIPIVGGGSTVKCSWDGRTLTCTRF